MHIIPSHIVGEMQHDLIGDSDSECYVICAAHAREFPERVAGSRHNVTWWEFFIRRHSRFDLSWEYRHDIKKCLSAQINERKWEEEKKTAKNRILIINSTLEIKFEDSTFTVRTKKQINKMAEQFDAVSIRNCSSNTM